MRTNWFRPAAWAVAAACAATAAGCSGNNAASQVRALNTSNVQRVANMYAAFQNFKGGRGPTDGAEFKKFIAGFEPNKLEMMGIDPARLDGLFISERDGQPFKVRYKVGGGRGSVDPVVFEQDGRDGQTQVGFTGGKVEAADPATAARWWSGKDRPAASGAPSGGRPSGRPPGAPTGPGGR
jgi:hypothetical protein